MCVIIVMSLCEQTYKLADFGIKPGTDGEPHLIVSNRYFELMQNTADPVDIPFGEGVDPDSLLAKMMENSAGGYMHGRDSHVGYYNTFRDLGGQRRYVHLFLSWNRPDAEFQPRYEPSGPQRFCIGDIVGVRLSLSVMKKLSVRNHGMLSCPCQQYVVQLKPLPHKC